ncbi:HTH_Tnp_Tc3_2 domain-containing protein [Trichonephila clavipes]|nr:HTH_Tnp_Tc3_2 domain-containing protein [Trichonephila clavipes]
MRTGIWKLLPKETDGAQHQTCLVSSLQLPVRQFQGKLSYRRLAHIGLYARRPVRCVPLTATHCRLRLTRSRENALWTPQQWSCVMFFDKYRFSLQSDSRQTLIWRAPGTRYAQANILERHRYGDAGWLVWGGIILVFRIDLHVQSVTMAATSIGMSLWNNMYVCFRAPWVLNFCLWMTTPVLTVQTL